MDSPQTRNRFKLVDSVLASMRQARYEIDGDTIALVWRAGTGDASNAEIEAWSKRTAFALAGQPNDPRLQVMLKTMAKDLQVKAEKVSKAMSSLAPPKLLKEDVK